MKQYRLTVSSPDGNIYQGDVVALYVRGCEGDLAVLAGHVPFVTALKPCDVRIELEDCSEIKGYTEGGIAPDTAWEDVPEDFECPMCLVGKDQFSEA